MTTFKEYNTESLYQQAFLNLGVKAPDFKIHLANLINSGADLSALDAEILKLRNEKNKKESLQNLYADMVEDVYNEMENVFGTRNDASAQAFAATYEAMLKRPASYIDEELGLADEALVLAHAEVKIASSDAYGVFRLKRIAQYQIEKAAIEQA